MLIFPQMESSLLSPKISKPLQIVLWLFAFYLAWRIIPSGYPKLMGAAGPTEYFATLGLSATMVRVVGFFEVVAPLLLFVPRVSFYGAMPLMVIMLTAGYYTGWSSDPLILAFLSLLIAVLARPSLLRKKPVITKIEI